MMKGGSRLPQTQTLLAKKQLLHMRQPVPPESNSPALPTLNPWGGRVTTIAFQRVYDIVMEEKFKGLKKEVNSELHKFRSMLLVMKGELGEHSAKFLQVETRFTEMGADGQGERERADRMGARLSAVEETGKEESCRVFAVEDRVAQIEEASSSTLSKVKEFEAEIGELTGRLANLHGQQSSHEAICQCTGDVVKNLDERQKSQDLRIRKLEDQAEERPTRLQSSFLARSAEWLLASQ